MQQPCRRLRSLGAVVVIRPISNFYSHCKLQMSINIAINRNDDDDDDDVKKRRSSCYD